MTKSSFEANRVSVPHKPAPAPFPGMFYMSVTSA